MARLETMTDLGPVNHKHCRHGKHVRSVNFTLFVLGMMLPSLGIVAAPDEPIDLQRRKASLEVQKLELEVAHLRDDRGEFHNWFVGVGGLLVGFAATIGAVWVARRTRRGELDQSVHDKRLESYPALVKAAERLAVYFPGGDPPASSIGPKECHAMGHAMSKWYFGGGGLLMSVEARDAYFRLARALTRASLAEDLRVPVFPRDAGDISVEKVKEYRAELELKEEPNSNEVENWRFGCLGREKVTMAQRFRDYVFLQHLSSALRTRLSDDLRSRRRPS